MLNAKDYQKKLANLEESAEKLNLEVFGIRYAIEGIVYEAKSNFKSRYDRIRELEDLAVALKRVIINVEESEIHLELPSALTISQKNKIVVTNFDSTDVKILAKNFRIAIMERDNLFNTAEKKFAQNLISAITEFEDAFFNYMR